MSLLRFIANVLWHIPFLGFITAFLTFILGIILTLLVVTAPLGLGLIQYSKFLLLPFSYSMVSVDDTNIQQNEAWKAYSFIIKIIYLPFGILLTLLTCVGLLFTGLTIIGLPVVVVILKSLHVYLNPVGKICVPHTVKDEITRQKAAADIDKYLK